MRFLALLLFLSSLAHASECYRGDVKDGGITGLKTDSTLYFKRAGSAGGRGGIVAQDKRGHRIYGDVRCAGGAPDACSFGTDGGSGKFQFIDNKPTIVLQHGKLAVIKGDGGEQDLRVVNGQKNGFNYPMEIVNDQKICANLFPQEDESEHEAPDPHPPSVTVPISR